MSMRRVSPAVFIAWFSREWRHLLEDRLHGSLPAKNPFRECNRRVAPADTLGVAVGDAHQTVQVYLSSSFVNLFTKFGHNCMVYAQEGAKFRLETGSLKDYYVRGQMIPLGAVADIKPTRGPAVITLYNLFPSATINSAANDRFRSGQALTTMESIAKKNSARRIKAERWRSSRRAWV
jgi:multidrug efflux pump subunit AcrB